MKVQDIDRLADEARQIHSSTERERFFNNLLLLTRELLQVSFSGLWVNDPLRGNARRFFPGPGHCSKEDDPSVLDSRSVVGEIIRSKKPFVSFSISSVPQWRRKAWSEGKGLVSYAGVPIFLNKKAVGVLSALDEKPKVFNSQDLEVLGQLSSAASIMFRRSRPDLIPDGTSCHCQLCYVREGSVLSCFTVDQMKEFERLRTVNLYPNGAIIFDEGAGAKGLYIVCRGRVKLVKADEEGRSIAIRIANPGELIGKTALFTGRPYFATAVALGEVQIAYIPKRKFVQFLSQNCDLFQALYQNLSTELEHLYRRLFKSAFNDNKRRMAAQILNLRESYGQETPEGVLLDLRLRHEDLAELIGTSTRTVIRIMNSFRDKRIIRTANKKIVILNEPALLKCAGEIF